MVKMTKYWTKTLKYSFKSDIFNFDLTLYFIVNTQFYENNFSKLLILKWSNLISVCIMIIATVINKVSDVPKVLFHHQTVQSSIYFCDAERFLNQPMLALDYFYSPINFMVCSSLTTLNSFEVVYEVGNFWNLMLLLFFLIVTYCWNNSIKR